MNTTSRIRVLIHCREAGVDCIKTLVSLSGQSVGARRLSVTLASSDPDSHTTPQARLLYGALGFSSLEVLDARGQHAAQALNLAAQGLEGHIALLDNGVRLAPRFLERCLDALHSARADAATALHTGGDATGVALARLRPFKADSLVRDNPMGPAALLRREAWEDMGGLRASLRLGQWDLWLRLAMAGAKIIRVPELLVNSPARQKLPPAQDGHAKAMLVVSSPGAFEPAVCRWAMALLRGDPWAQPFESGRIPAPRDVDAMFARQRQPGGEGASPSQLPPTGTA